MKAQMDNVFIIIPPHIRSRKDLTPLEKMVFGAINGLTQKEGYCYASNDWIGEIVGISDSMASKHISKLAKKGFIRLELMKIKKDERTGMAGEKYGTIRHIYIYQTPQVENPSTTNGAPPSTTNGEYKEEIENKEGETPSLSSECLYKDFSQKDQLQLLQSIMGIYETVDFGAVALRVRNSKSRADVLQTVYHWWFQDIHDGKIGSNKFIANEEATYVDDVPKSFTEATRLMDERLRAKEALEPGFISSHNIISTKYDL